MLLSPVGVSAQESQPDEPVYIVQPGDILWDIALRFGVSLQDLEDANQITDPNQIAVGDQLVIPGLQGVHGILTTETVGFGETLTSLSRRFQVPENLLVRLNRLTSPEELYAGANLIIPQQDEAPPAGQRAVLAPGQSLLELAVSQGANPWDLVARNELSGTWSAIAGDVLRVPGESEADSPGALPPAISRIEVKPLPLVQGKAAVVHVLGQEGLTLGGDIAGKELHFFSQASGDYVALQGVHAMTEPGQYPLLVTGTLPGGLTFNFVQNVFVKGGDYPYDPTLEVNPETIDPAVTEPEQAEWEALAASFSPVKQWQGIFGSPVPSEFSDCFPSRFGNRRSYNGGPYETFHTGLDFCGDVGTEIYAPAAGTVVFAGPLTVRGNATVIDHGWGVYSGYLHQSKILVKPGDHVEKGQIIGLVGNTGRVTGPHLHWEIFVGGIQVDPMDWLKQAYP
jgi:murein DD-endopeptidase MepM/ murein hydrolase activator NlpD